MQNSKSINNTIDTYPSTILRKRIQRKNRWKNKTNNQNRREMGNSVQQRRTVLGQDRLQGKTNMRNRENMQTHIKNRVKTTDTTQHAHRSHPNIHR